MVLLLSSRFLLVACVALAGAEVALDITNFDEVVGTTPWVIEFASDMCMSCKEFAPTWHAFAAKVEGIEGLGVGRVNIDKKVGLQLAQRTPTVLSKIPKQRVRHFGRHFRACSPPPARPTLPL
ncbi:hypothetical protein CTAYLR_004129 [Chrysophaeum taylorii]|uniref:Thioredoxin domain-containing protein n=1 Tax=Chrysophaeum taylorii TaxID=2483200 RepID=A0AAD7UN89_9STRA|nr:hypothetical protein CTAYLR_004129 [Chrysophaeum taylorii]